MPPSILLQTQKRKFANLRLSAYLQISALISLSVWMLLLLPDFLAQKGWSSQKIGWAMGSYFSVYLLVQILAEHIANRYGNINTALIGSMLGNLWKRELPISPRVARFHLSGAHSPWVRSGD